MFPMPVSLTQTRTEEREPSHVALSHVVVAILVRVHEQLLPPPVFPYSKESCDQYPILFPELPVVLHCMDSVHEVSILWSPLMA